LKKAFPVQSFGSIIEELRTGRFETVGQLWEYVHNENPTLDFDSFRSQLKQLISAGIVEVKEPQLSNFSAYLSSWEYGLKLWFFAVTTLASVAVVELLELGFPWVVLRWVAATFLLLFAPGFAVTWTLFPSKQQQSNLNRLALTIAISLFLVPVIGLVLNYSVIGIQSSPVALIVGAMTEGFLFVGAYREFTMIPTS